MPSTSAPRRMMARVGYWMSDKKIRKLNFTAYCDKLRRLVILRRVASSKAFLTIPICCILYFFFFAAVKIRLT